MQPDKASRDDFRRTVNDLLWLATENGRSTKLGHLRNTAEVNFNFLKMTRILLRQMDTSENYADIFTNIFTTTKLRYHFSAWSMMGVNRNNNSQADLNVEFHRYCETCGNCNFVEFVQNVSSPTVGVHGVAEARDEFAGAVFLVEDNWTLCFFLWLQAPFA